MKRTTISLTDELAELAAHEANQRRISVSELIRNLIQESLVGTQKKPREIPWEGLINESAMVPAEEVEATLSKSWADDIDRDRG